MTELSKTLNLLKARWPEVLLLVGGQVMLALMMRIFNVSEPEEMTSAVVSAMVVIVAVALLWMVLFFGFLRSVFLDGNEELMPTQLFARGRSFFWRAVGFSFVVPMAMLLLAQLILVIAAGILAIDIEQPTWLLGLASATALLVLIKFLALPPAIMVVRDVPFLHSLAMVRYYKLRQRPAIIYLVAVLVVVQALHGWSGLGTQGSETDLFWTGLFAMIVQLILLVIMVTAVQFVSESDYGQAEQTREKE